MSPSEISVPVFRPTSKDCEGSWEAYITKIEPKFKKVRPLENSLQGFLLDRQCRDELLSRGWCAWHWVDKVRKQLVVRVWGIHNLQTKILLNMQVGICKIIPPKSWAPCKGKGMEEREFTLERPIEQTVTGKQGFFQALQLVRKQMSLQEEYGPLAKDKANQPKGETAEDVEREFWRSTHLHPPIYGADCEATLCDDSTSVSSSLLSLHLVSKLFTLSWHKRRLQLTRGHIYCLLSGAFSSIAPYSIGESGSEWLSAVTYACKSNISGLLASKRHWG